MYNRYIPGSDGNYRRERVPSPTDDIPAPAAPPNVISEPVSAGNDCAPGTGGLGRSFGKIETGDLLVLAILALLLLDGEGDQLIVLIAAIAFLFF